MAHCNEADAIVRDLAARPEPEIRDDNNACVFCGQYDGHDDDCLWQRARFLIYAHDHLACHEEGG